MIGAADATGVGGSSASSTSLSPADAGDASIESGGVAPATSRRLPIELSSLSSSRSLRSSSASVPVTSPACGVASGAAPPGVLGPLAKVSVIGIEEAVYLHPTRA